jgi:hypothetical protein
MSKVREVRLTICETSMSAEFKVNICKSKVEILPSHNRPTNKMWMGSVPISQSDKVEWRRCYWLKEVGSCYCQRMGLTNDEVNSLARENGQSLPSRFTIYVNLDYRMWIDGDMSVQTGGRKNSMWTLGIWLQACCRSFFFIHHYFFAVVFLRFKFSHPHPYSTSSLYNNRCFGSPLQPQKLISSIP